MIDTGHRTIWLALLIAAAVAMCLACECLGQTRIVAGRIAGGVAAPGGGDTPLIPAERIFDWALSGVAGGIPDSSLMTVYTNLNTNATAAQINAAIQACPSNQVVQLTNGTYTLNARLESKTGVVLRGKGITNTILMPNHGNYAGGIWIGNDTYYSAIDSANYNGGALANWTSGYSKGESNLTFSTTNGLIIGNLVHLDQSNDFVIVNPGGYEGFQGNGRKIAGVTNGSRVLRQSSRVTAISGTTVTISPPIQSTIWNAALAPQAFWIGNGNYTRRFGIEDLTINGTNCTSSAPYGENIYLSTSIDCWMKNIKSILPPTQAHISSWGSFFCEIKHCIFTETKNYASQSYGILPTEMQWIRIEDNVFDKVTTPIVPAACSTFGVIGYNYFTNMYYTAANRWLMAAIQPHSTHNMGWLMEGNYIHSKINGDFIHGSTSDHLIYRNRIAGYSPTSYDGVNNNLPANNNMQILNIDITNRNYSSVGNILGTVGIHTYFQKTPTADPGEPVIYSIGRENTAYGKGWGNDPVTYDSFFRHMDYNTISNAVAYNLTNGNVTLSNSFYLSAKPSFFGDMTWPPFDPLTVTTNDLGTNNHAYWTNLPAGRYYVNGNWTQ